MASAIAAQFAHVSQEDAATTVANHIRLTWEPRMHARLREQVVAAGQDCDPVVAAAVDLLDRPA